MTAEPCILRTIDSPIGPLLAGARDDGVCLLEFAGPERRQAQTQRVRRLFACDTVDGDHRWLVQLREELGAYFAGALTRFTVPLVAPGTPFQERVWSELLRIPYGETRSYESIAASVTSTRAQRAVGRTNGLNRIAIVIPCHRVVNKDGRLGGYGGGLWRKDALLGLERTGRMVLPRQKGLF